MSTIVLRLSLASDFLNNSPNPAELLSTTPALRAEQERDYHGGLADLFHGALEATEHISSTAGVR